MKDYHSKRSFYSSPLANITLAILPNIHFFGLKRLILKSLGFKVGKNVKINGGVKFYGRGEISIGDETWLGIGCKFFNANSNIFIGSKCDIASQVIFHTGTHEIGSSSRRAGMGKSLPIKIADGNWVGCGAIFTAGSITGVGSIIAAGAVCNKTYSSNVLIGGVPAKEIKPL